VALVLVDVIDDLEFEGGERVPDRCVLFTASDAFDPTHNRRALDEMALPFGADLTESTHLALSRQAERLGKSSAMAVKAKANSTASARISRACRLSWSSAHVSLTRSTPLAVSRSPREARPVHVPPCPCRKPSAPMKRGKNSTSRAPRAIPKYAKTAAARMVTATPATPMR
jgi:hypothetical protein